MYENRSKQLFPQIRNTKPLVFNAILPKRMKIVAEYRQFKGFKLIKVEDQLLREEAAKVQKQVIMDRMQKRPPLLDWVQYKQWNCSNATFTDFILAECTPNLKSTKSQKQVTGSGLEDSGLAIAVIPPSQILVSAFCTNTHVNKQPTTDTAKDGGKPQHKG